MYILRVSVLVMDENVDVVQDNVENAVVDAGYYPIASWHDDPEEWELDTLRDIINNGDDFYLGLSDDDLTLLKKEMENHG